MADNTVTSLDAALKKYYKAGRLVRLGYKNHPLLAALNKRKDFYGKNVPIVPWYAGTAGRSRTFTAAQGNASAEATVEFTLVRKKDYAVSYIEMEALKASANDDGSFLKLGTDSVDKTNQQCTRNLSISLFRNHGGARGVISAISTNLITLTNPGDIVNFEVNQKLYHSTTDGTSGALEAESSTVSKVDRQAGTITLADATGFDVGNYLFCDGDFGASINGIDSWIPSTVATNDSFLGVNRSLDSRLRGLYVDAASSGYDFIEALEVADAFLAREGASPNFYVMNPIDLRQMKTAMGSQIEYDLVGSPDVASVTFKAIQFPSVGGAGVIKIVSDPDCPQGYSYLLDLDTWTLMTLGDFPQGLEGNGFKFITAASADKVEVRVGGYMNLACWKPDGNARIKLY